MALKLASILLPCFLLQHCTAKPPAQQAPRVISTFAPTLEPTPKLKWTASSSVPPAPAISLTTPTIAATLEPTLVTLAPTLKDNKDNNDAFSEEARPTLQNDFPVLWQNHLSPSPQQSTSPTADTTYHQAVLLASDGSISDRFGYAVSGIGESFYIIGAYGDDFSTGSAYVFTSDSRDFNSKQWMQAAKVMALDGSSSDRFGYAVSGMGEASFVAGASRDDSSSSGSAYVFTHGTSDNWVQSVKVGPSDGISREYFGYAVSGMGESSFVIGSYLDDDQGTDSGSAYVFTIDSGIWAQVAKVMASHGSSLDCFGIALSGMSKSSFAIGSPHETFYKGAVYVFTSVNGSWAQAGKVEAPDGDTFDYFGQAVADMSDTSFVIGAHQGSGSGSVYVFTSESGSWIYAGKVVASDRGDNFGYAVSGMSNVSFTVGAYLDDDQGLDSGSAYVFTSDSGSWAQANKVVASDGFSSDYFGLAVSGISESTFLVGTPYGDGDNRDTGLAYIFDKAHFITTAATTGKQMNMLKSIFDTIDIDGSGSIDREEFFETMIEKRGPFKDALFNLLENNYQTRLLVSGSSTLPLTLVPTLTPTLAPTLTPTLAPTLAPTSAEIYYQAAKLEASDARRDDYFSYGVSAASDSYLVVGAPYDDDQGTKSGSAYIFTVEYGSCVSKSWVQAAKVEASDGYSYDYFGYSVSGMTNTSFVVGALYDDVEDTNSGSAYVFTIGNDSWVQADKVAASDGYNNDIFGYAVSGGSNNFFVVGALQCDDDQYTNSGSAYVFTNNFGSWGQAAKVVASDPSTNAYFGVDVSIISISSFVAGAKNTGNIGAAYAFTSVNGSWVQASKVEASDGYSNNQFGISVSALGSSSFVVGADYQESAYVFTSGNESWAQAAKVEPDPTSDYFGHAVSGMSDVAFAVGAYGDDDLATNSGSAYVFTASNSGTWVQVDKVYASDGSSSDYFGYSVSGISGSAFLVGALYGDGQVTNSGTAYVFTKQATGHWINLVSYDSYGDGWNGNMISLYSLEDGESTALWNYTLATNSSRMGLPQNCSVNFQVDKVDNGTCYLLKQSKEGLYPEQSSYTLPTCGIYDRRNMTMETFFCLDESWSCSAASENWGINVLDIYPTKDPLNGTFAGGQNISVILECGAYDVIDMNLFLANASNTSIISNGDGDLLSYAEAFDQLKCPALSQTVVTLHTILPWVNATSNGYYVEFVSTWYGKTDWFSTSLWIENLCYADAGEYCLQNGHTVVPCNWKSTNEDTWYYCLNGTYRGVCPNGHYCNETYHVEPYSCRAGYYCPDEGMEQPLECNSGYYCPTTGLITPTTCPMGFYCPDQAMQLPIVCPIGFYCPDEGMEQPLKCNSGYYCPTSGMSTRNASDAGYYVPANGSHVNQTYCSAGYFCPNTTMQLPTVCAVGFYCPGGASHYICSSGQYCPASGMYSPTDCPLGFYCPDEGMDQPLECNSGYYCPTAGMFKRNMSDAGYYVPANGSYTNQTLCTGGYYCPSTRMKLPTLCPLGFYCPGGASRYECNSGYYCPDTGMSSSTISDPGYYVPGDGNYSEQILCPEGYYCPNNGMTTVDGYYCEAGTVCVGTGNTEATTCPRGYYCTGGSSETICAADNYCPAGSSDMTNCTASYPYLQICPGEGLADPFNCSSDTSGDTDKWGNYLCYEPFSSSVAVTSSCGYTDGTYDATTNTLSFTCSCNTANLYSGTYCTEKQSLATSFAFGGIALGLAVFVMVPCLVCDGAWMVAGTLDKRYIHPVVQKIRKSTIVQKEKDAAKAHSEKALASWISKIEKLDKDRAPDNQVGGKSSSFYQHSQQAASRFPTEIPSEENSTQRPSTLSECKMAAESICEGDTAPSNSEYLSCDHCGLAGHSWQTCHLHTVGLPPLVWLMQIPEVAQRIQQGQRTRAGEGAKKIWTNRLKGGDGDGKIDPPRLPPRRSSTLPRIGRPGPQLAAGGVAGLAAVGVAGVVLAEVEPQSLMGNGVLTGVTDAADNHEHVGLVHGTVEESVGAAVESYEDIAEVYEANSALIEGAAEEGVAATIDNYEDFTEIYQASSIQVFYTEYLQPCIQSLDFWKSLKCVFAAVAMFCGSVGADISKMIATAYLIVKGLASALPDLDLDDRMDDILNSLKSFLAEISSYLTWIADAYEWAIDALENFDLTTITMSSLSVTCEGAQAPSRLFANVLVVLVVTVIFETHLFAFIDISINAASRLIRTYLQERKYPMLLVAVATNAARLLEYMFKYIIQLLQGMTAVSVFVPYHSTTQPVCGDVDQWYRYLGSALFWILLFVSFHVLIRTFVWGVPDGVVFRSAEGYLPNWFKDLCCYTEASHHKGERYYSSNLKERFRYHLTEEERDEVPSLADIIVMIWVDVKNKNIDTLKAYIKTMLWKILQLLKMTFGIWDETLCQKMEIVKMSEAFDDDETDDIAYHQDMVCLVGQSHCLVWQFASALVSISKFMEAANFVPVYAASSIQVDPFLLDKELAWWSGDSVFQKIKGFVLKLKSFVQARCFGFTTHLLKFACLLLLCLSPSAIWIALSAFLSFPALIFGTFEKLGDLGFF